MKLRVLGVCVAILCATVLIFGGAVYGQGGGTGTIQGTITDSTAAVIAKAKVTVTNVSTGVATVVESNDAGDYTVPYLRPAMYTVTAEAPGFEKTVVQNITVFVDQTVRADAVLKTGAVTETVTVSASSVALDTENAEISQTIANTQVENLPLQDRNFVNFLLLGSTAVTTNGEQATFRQGKGDAISINGARPTSNNYTLDGLTNTDTALGTPAVILSQDAIQEFKEQTSTYSAEYGYGANQVNIVSKSGGNDVHGSVFWFGRNDALDAQLETDASKLELRQNQFGFVASGPVYIPGKYNGRNKTFWLVNYEGARIINGGSIQGRVPTAAMLSGDFSTSGLPNWGSVGCFNPAYPNTPGALPGNSQIGEDCMPIDPLTGANFPSNKIPANRFSKLANAALGLPGIFPAITCPACVGNNFKAGGNSSTHSNQQTYKLDQDFGRYGKIFGRGTVSSYLNTAADGNTLSIPLGFQTTEENEKSWTIGHTISIGSNLVNEARYGQLTPIVNQCTPPVSQSVISAIGFAGTFQNETDCYRWFPNIAMGQFNSYGGHINGQTTSNIPVREFADSLTYIRGKHTLTMGVNYRHWVQKRNLAGDFNGELTFTNQLISENGSSNGFIAGGQKGCPTPACGTGSVVADFLLGYYAGAGTFLPGPFTPAGELGNLNKYHFTYFAPFFQDDWKVNNRLTVNMGLRWDYRSVPYEQSNKMFWLDLQDPNGGMCMANPDLAIDGIAPAGTMYHYCGRRNPADGSKRPFAPRIGMALRPFGGDNTVIRAGYGIFFDSSEGREIDDSGDIYPYEVRAALNPTVQPVATAPKQTNQIFIPATTLAPVTPALNTFIAVIISETPKNPYVQQWDFSVQRQVNKNTTVEVDYTGTKGIHLLSRNNIAQAFLPSPSCSSNVNAPGCPVASRLPYANFQGFFIDSHWLGRSNYQAGTAKVEHRSGNLTLQASYTWSKSLDDKSAAAGIGASGGGFQGFLDNHNPELDYGLSDFDVKSRFVSNFVYQLPVGRGQRYASGANRLVDAAIGGWQLGGIITLQKGFPFSVFAPDNKGLLDIPFGASLNRANLVGGVSPTKGFTRTPAEWFNPAAFSAPAIANIGNTPRNYLRAPGINDVDFSLAKSFPINEKTRFQLRVDALNAFNHPRWSDVSQINSTFGAPSFGSINAVAASSSRIVQLGAKFQF